MKQLDYGQLLGPDPIKLSIGNLRKPTLREISKLTFPLFTTYQYFLTLSPEEYYTQVNKDLEAYWAGLSDTQQASISLYDIILKDKSLCNTYLAIFNFFFVEKVMWSEGLFLFVNLDKQLPDNEVKVTADVLCGAVGKETFDDVLTLLRQVCLLGQNDAEDESKRKFKNTKAKRLWRRMKAAEKKQKELSEHNADMLLPNLISSVTAKSLSLNIDNIWNITLFQLYDQFYRLQNNDIHSINSTSVAVWGDEKNKFDATLWYKNIFDKQ